MNINIKRNLKQLVNLIITASVIFIFGCMNTSNESIDSNKVVVQNYYWAKPGTENEVYQQRLLASSVREKYGHPVGRVLRLTSKSDSLPNVIWECEYASLEARNMDVERLTNNEEFSKVAKKMGALIKKFDRAIYETTASGTRTE